MGATGVSQRAVAIWQTSTNVVVVVALFSASFFLRPLRLDKNAVAVAVAVAAGGSRADNRGGEG